ncbi:BTB POZ domain [Lecanosticta acicola]|uniref:BTB POZ domain n=1 Tax=Lecanosticta acicola TaxID=111012 RepID=A0AAI8Z232_9PEZI|nr:BTB POZ domain [Lecanosticta acicola]
MKSLPPATSIKGVGGHAATAAQTPKRAGFLGRFGEYFDKDTYSDVTIRSGSDTIKAHKVVIAQASPYFVSCFERGFKETNQPLIDLHEDEPKAVRGMIAYAYGLHFDGKPSYDESRAIPSASDQSLAYAKFQIDLWVVSVKYMFFSVAGEIQYCLKDVLASLLPSAGFPECLLEAAHHVYVEHASTAAGLRPVVVMMLNEHMDRLKVDQRFRGFLLEIPELACDLLLAAHGGSEEAQLVKAKRKFKPTFASLPSQAYLRKPRLEPPRGISS